MSERWMPVGTVEELKNELEAKGGLKEVVLDEKRIVISWADGEFGAISARCNHMGGPLAKGKLKQGCIECPWHYWQFDRKTGVSATTEASKHFTSTAGTLPRYPVKLDGGRLFVDLQGETPRERPTYAMKTNLGRDPRREPGRLRVLGLSTTAMDREHPRYSTSETLLKHALATAQTNLDVETRCLSLSELKFRNCEGFYSKSEKACTWPCSITKMDPTDEMAKVYEGLVHWADVVILASPIRWGSASSLYYKMAERLNAVQNQLTLNNRALIRNKVAAFIITGGQDNVQAVAGQMLGFFGELGFVFPPFPFVAHSLGWSSEDLERNMDYVESSDDLKRLAFELVERATQLSRKLLGSEIQSTDLNR